MKKESGCQKARNCNNSLNIRSGILYLFFCQDYKVQNLTLPQNLKNIKFKLIYIIVLKINNLSVSILSVIHH